MISHPCVSLPQMLLKPMEYYTFWVVLGAMGSLFEKKCVFFEILGKCKNIGNHEISTFSVKKRNLMKFVALQKHQYFLRNIKVLEPPDSQNSMISINFMNFMKFHEIPWFSRNFMIFVKFHDFLIKNGKRTLPRATTRGSSPNHCNYKQIHRSRRGAIRPQIIKITENPLFSSFPPFSPRNWENVDFH